MGSNDHMDLGPDPIAERLLKTHGALEFCPIHEEIAIDQLVGINDALEEATELIAQGDPSVAHWTTVEQARAALTEALRNAGQECPYCAKNMSD